MGKPKLQSSFFSLKSNHYNHINGPTNQCTIDNDS